MEARFGNIFFTSKFDSGNLARVEKPSRDEEDEDAGSGYPGEVRPDYEFNVWTKPDCAGTDFENGNRSWFYFGVRGAAMGKLLKINIMNLNRQGKLYSQGHCPFVKVIPGKPKWDRIRDKPTWENSDGNFIMSFTYRVQDPKTSMAYFAFCFPWAYSECQDQLDALDEKFRYCAQLNAKSSRDQIYYHRELLCYSLDKLRVDLITISDCGGMTEEEERFDSKLFPDHEKPRCKTFKGKRVYIVTSRVHPGETPGSFVFNGFLDFILREDDPRARQLRRQFVFKLIPLLNPDGVQRGHYRTDPRGVNLNRVYADPDFEIYPTIYAAKSILVYYHVHYQVNPEKNDVKARLSAKQESSRDKQSDGAGSLTNGMKGSHNPDSNKRSSANLKNRVKENNPRLESANRSRTYKVVMDDHGNSDTSVMDTVKISDNSVIDGNIISSSTSRPKEMSDSSVTCDNFQTISMNSTCELINAVTISDNEEPVGLSDSLLSSDGKTHVTIDLRKEHGYSSREEPYIGNEGSDDEPDFTMAGDNSRQYAPHLCDPKLRQIASHESGIAFYVDLHGHASKRGCFIYGNYFEDEDTQVENILFPKAISMNTAHFDFGGCNFTEKNMYTKDKRDGMSKEGSGRVGIYKAIGIIHSYTLECNYNTGRMVNCVPTAYGDNGRATPPPLAGFPPKYTQAHFEEVGKAMAIAALDMTETNPWSRLTLSEFNSIHGLRDWVRRFLRGQRGLPRGPRNATLRNNSKNNNNTTPSTSVTHARTSFTRMISSDSNGTTQPIRPGMPRTTASDRTRHPLSRTVSADTGTSNVMSSRPSLTRRQSNINNSNSGSNNSKNLAPVKEASRPSFDRNRRRNTAPPSSITASVSTGVNVTTPNTSANKSPSAVTLTLTTATMSSKDSYTTLPRSNHVDQSVSRSIQNQTTSSDSDLIRLQSAGNKKPTYVAWQQQPESMTGNNIVMLKGLTPRSKQQFLSNSAGSNTLAWQLSNNEPSEDDDVGQLHRRMSVDSNIVSVEEEDRLMMSQQLVEEKKVQQLRNMIKSAPRWIQFEIQVKHKPPTHLTSKVLEPPKSDPPKRRVRRLSQGKKRSSSYSPKSSKFSSKGGSGTDSDAEKKRPKPSKKKGMLARGKTMIMTDPTDLDTGDLNVTAPLEGSALVLSPRPTIAFCDPGQFQQSSPTPQPPSDKAGPTAQISHKREWNTLFYPDKSYVEKTGHVAVDEEMMRIIRETSTETAQGHERTAAYWIDL